jgi:hypothetical protein
MTAPSIGTLPDGTRGFDANGRISLAKARAFHAAGFRFAVRYVRRAQAHSYDITTGELVDLLAGGLGVMLVQHVAPPGWRPTAKLGHDYGTVAANEALAAGYPAGCTLWCDLEGVGLGVLPADVIGFCNAWYDAAKLAGYSPGLYVGDAPGLSARDLYYRLKFARFWGAYNLNADQVPLVRGLQMKQTVASAALKVGVPFEFDVDTIRADAKGSSPTLVLPFLP